MNDSSAAPSAAPVAAPDRPPRRVLVVDDHADAADTLGMLLDQLGYTTSVAYDGLEAVRQEQQFLPELVIIDVHMRLVDGMSAARAIRACNRQPRPVLMALTGDSLPATRQAAFEAGFDLHFVKPLPQGEFELLMENVLPRR